jgi:putative MATE family efflux protein
LRSEKNDFTQGSILKKLAAFMLPILGALVLQAAYGAVDLLVVGRFGSTIGLSAVSTGSQVLNLVTFVVTQLAMGVTVLIARYLGEKKPELIGSVIGGAAVVFTLLSAVLFVVMVGFARSISVLMQAPAEAVALTASYVRICGSGIFFIVAYNLLAAVFRGLGDSKSPLLFVLVACVVNIIGDLVLVAGFHLDAAGAAIATVAAQAVSVVCAVVILLKKKLPFTIRKSDFRLNLQSRKFLSIGLPLALQEFLTQLSFLALCAFVNRLGLEASSGYGVACKIVNFAMLIPSSLMQSMASFVSQNMGAGNPKRAKKAMFTGIGIGLAFGCAMFALVFFRGDLLSNVFTTDAAVIQNAFAYLKGFAPETLATAVLFSMVGYFNGSDKTVWVMVQGLVQTLLVRLPMAYIMSIQPNANLTMIGLAAPTSTVVGIVLNVCFFLALERRSKKAAV